MAAMPSAGKRILLVEDDDDVNAALAEKLREAGYTVESVRDGLTAWDRLLRGVLPALVVLDLKLPGMSGWELLERLRTSTTLLAVPVVVVSAYLGFPPAGALAWLKKPIDPSQLLETVRRLAPAPL